ASDVTANGAAPKVRYLDLVLDPQRWTVSRGGKGPIRLQPQLFKLLDYLSKRPSPRPSVKVTCEAVWGAGFDAVVGGTVKRTVFDLNKELAKLGVRVPDARKTGGYILEEVPS